MLWAISVTVILIGLLNLPIVNAKPMDPTEGLASDSETVGDWNWGLNAYVEGWWVWFWMRRPPEIVFTYLWHSGNRWGGLGVWYIGNLQIQCVSEHYNHYAYSPNSAVGVYHDENEYDYGKTKAWSWFQNWIGQQWLAETPWAVIGFE